MPRFNYGGQALIEGVMMRGRDAIAVALRHPDGRIVFETERLDAGAVHGNRAARWPFVRGLVVLYETLVVGTRWLVRSAGLQAEDEGVEIGKGGVALMLLITLVLGVGLFFILPLVVATVTAGSIENDLVQHLVEGLTRVAIFLGYLVIISRTPDIHRVFQYHGAEHMAIHTFEANEPLRPEYVRTHPTAHPRCGTEFLVVVILLSIIAFSLVGRQPPLVMIASRILLIPVIAAVGYELLKLGARHRSNPVVKAIMWPGILVQMITTKQPTDDMIEVAIVSLEEAIRADGDAIPAEGLELPRDAMPKPGEVLAGVRAAQEQADAEASSTAAPDGSATATRPEDAPTAAAPGTAAAAGTAATAAAPAAPGLVHATTVRAAEGEAIVPVSIDPPLA